ncbi:MAG: cupin domain-containing protein [Gammaproteobacteria bacterium]
MMLGTVLGLAGMTGHAESTAKSTTSGTVVDTLLKRGLVVAPGTDVIIDRVTLPPDITLSRRWHPGEMFVYVMKGTVTVSPDGKDEIVGKKGDVVDVPFKQVYAARTNGEGAQLLLFRVHEAGQPIRVKVENEDP